MKIKSTLHRVNLSAVIKETKGQIFNIKFWKKDGTLRIMNARVGVSKGVKGTGYPIHRMNPSMRVFDMDKAAFRTINLEKTVGLSTSGVSFRIVG